jgi:hypothetical protein
MVDIVEYTPRRLVLQKRNDSIRLFLLGGVGMLLVSCLVAYATVRTTSVRCARGPGGLTCDATEKLLGLIPLDRRRIEHVQRAFVGETGDSRDPSYRVELGTGASSDTPLSNMTVSKWQCQFFVHSFNELADSGKQAADLLQLPDLIGVVTLAPLFAVALLCFMMALPYRLEVDGDLGRLTIRDGIRRQACHHLADVEDVRVEERESDGHTIREVVLLLKSGQRQPLAIEPDQAYLVGDYLPRPMS